MFIVLEGQNGTGKTSVIRKLQDSNELNKIFDAVYYTRHPGATKLGNTIRNMVVEQTHEHSPKDHLTRQALYMVGMRDFVIHFNGMLSSDNVLVLCDRYFLSTLVYGLVQGVSVNSSYNFFETLVNVYPDYTILLDTSPDEIARRLKQRPHKNMDIESSISYRTRIRMLYLSYIQAWPGTVDTIHNSEAPLDWVVNRVLDMIKEFKDARDMT